MKKLLLLLSFLALLTQIGNAQTSHWIWAETSSGDGYENGFGLYVDTGGHIFGSGRVASSGALGGISYNTSTVPFSEKFDTSGAGIWSNTTAFSGFLYCEGYGIDNYDNTYVTGINGIGMEVGKYDKYGNSKWAYTIQPNNGNNVAGTGITADNAGYVYLVGTFNPGSFTMNSVTFDYPGSSGNQGIFIAKLDSNGNCIWGKVIYGAGDSDGVDQPRDVVVDNQGYIYFIGDYKGQPKFGSYIPPSQTGNSYQNFFVAKYDTAGNEVWVSTSTNSYGSDFGGSLGLALDSCDDIYVTGIFQNTAVFNGSSFSVTSQGGEDGFVAKLNNSGQWQWVSTVGSSGRDAGFAICTDKHNEVYVGGDYGGNANLGNGVTITGSGGGFVAKFANSTGQVLWALGGLGSTSGHVGGLAVDRSGYAYVIGDYSGSATFGTHTINGSGYASNIFLAKLDTVAPRLIIPVVDSEYCPGSIDTISYTTVGAFNGGNTFSVQLSDSTGSFVNDTTIGQVTSDTSGTVVITIPSNTPQGSNYLIRVVSSNPATSSYVNGCGAYFQQNVYPNDFYIKIGNSLTGVTLAASSDSICSGGAITIKANGGSSYLWSTGAIADSIVVNPTSDTIYSVLVSNGTGCSKDTSIAIIVNAAPLLVINPVSPNVCSGSPTTLSVPTSGSNYAWSPSAGLSTTSGDSVIITNPTTDLTYTVSGLDSLGCLVTASDTIKVVAAPNKPTITIHWDTLISSASSDNQWNYEGKAINGAINQTYVITGSTSGYSVTVTNEANGCTTTSDTSTTTGISQLSVISNQLSIYPNPFNNNIFIKINSSASSVNEWSLQLTDVLGRTVYTEASLNYNNEINLSDLPSGVYFITVINKTARAVFPVVKQN